MIAQVVYRKISSYKDPYHLDRDLMIEFTQDSDGAMIIVTDDLQEKSAAISHLRLGRFDAGEFPFALQKTILFGPREDQERRVIAVFAGLHGDEPAGTLACQLLIKRFKKDPNILRDCELHLYPACNPWGILFNQRTNANGADLNRIFWTDSKEPEIQILEAELSRMSFDGIISLHADSDSYGLYGYTQGRQINRDLLHPALLEAARWFPVNLTSQIDGFHASGGMIDDCFSGVLRPPESSRGHPFEIIFETPGRAPRLEQAYAGAAAVMAIIKQHRRFLSLGWGI
jgi:protein MpaA